MYRKVEKYVKSRGLKVNEKYEFAYGKINGYFLVIKQNPQVYTRHTIQLGVKPGTGENFSSISDFLNQCTAKYQYLKNASYIENKITAEFEGSGRGWAKKYASSMGEFIDELISYCQCNGYVPCCESCGNEAGVSLYQIKGMPLTVCDSCYASLSGKMQQEMDEKTGGKGSNIITGIIGAILGSLIGVALWIVIYQAGYLCALAGYVMVVFALKGYQKFGGRLDIKGIIISCLICIAMLFLTELACLAIEIYKNSAHVTFLGAFESISSYLAFSEVRNSCIYDLVIGYLLMIVGAFGTVRQAVAENRGISGLSSKVEIVTNPVVDTTRQQGRS